MLNTQATESRRLLADDTLDVVDVWRTIQGEGPFAGRPAVFIRLAGCNLKCPLCDTDYTSKRSVRPVEEVISQVRILAGDRTTLAVITGGEPFRQSLGPLVTGLMVRGLTVQIETNGTYFDKSIPEPVWNTLHVVCSPKTGLINSRMVPHITAYKYILEAGKICEDDGLPTSSLGERAKPTRPPSGFTRTDIYVQPMDAGEFTQNQLNVRAAVDSCMEYGYRLSLQMHKIAGVP